MPAVRCAQPAAPAVTPDIEERDVVLSFASGQRPNRLPSMTDQGLALLIVPAFTVRLGRSRSTPRRRGSCGGFSFMRLCVQSAVIGRSGSPVPIRPIARDNLPGFFQQFPPRPPRRRRLRRAGPAHAGSPDGCWLSGFRPTGHCTLAYNACVAHNTREASERWTTGTTPQAQPG